MPDNLSFQASVVIPCYNAADHIRSCLEALADQTIDRSAYEIIVVDDGSTDDTSERADGLCDKVVRIANSGPAAARNRGVKESSGNLVLFTDSDCIPDSDWVEKMTMPFNDPCIAGVKGAYRTEQTAWIARFVQAEYEVKYQRMIKQPFIDFIDTYSAAFRRSLFDSLGGFDTRFPGASVEDQEFSFRAAEAGHRMVFAPEAIVRHRHADTLAWYFRKKKNIGYWKTVVLRRHPSKAISDSHTPQHLKMQLPLAILSLAALPMIPMFGSIPFITAVVLFLLAGIPETRHCFRRYGFLLAATSPVIMWVRSCALSLGLFQGMIETSRRNLLI